MKKSIGVNVPVPKQTCTDNNCPFHGTLGVHGRQFVGRVISDKMTKSVTVEWERRKFIPKYERYAKARSRVKAHNPLCLNAKQGDTVRVMETRPLSKTKNFVVIKIGKEE
ncbi:30S ribosomal protein S17 [Candidatus Woesearchaeota archaeon]|nr:30S ribosomal protein S17 [Candidatus Woesearchaeota archaeon]|tara:strand:+ start:530 stop:859 length:330 start_codon:yes stop_codon:yes gene_type:complete